MSTFAGRWFLTLAVIEPGNSATIPVTLNDDGSTEPEWWQSDHTLTLEWKNGRRQVWSWANLLSADYEPPRRKVVERG